MPMAEVDVLGARERSPGERATSQTDGRLRRSLQRVRDLATRHPMATAFVILAVVVRLTFWWVTGRVWEDALITLTPARNVWEGNGLTHHISEPRVHSFTSPVSVLIPIVGESVGQGMVLLRLSSLLASVVSIIFAYRIGLVFAWSKATNVLVLGFLATDQLQVLFGMAGMETQVATAVLLGGMYALFARRWMLLGWMLGAAALCRPEFGLWILPAAIGVLAVRRREALRPLGLATAIMAPWVIFATVYYGSPVPHTIHAKNMYPTAGLGATAAAMQSQAGNLWRTLSPFFSYVFVLDTPFPQLLLKLTAFTVVALACCGVWFSARRSLVDIAPAVFVGTFYAYEIVAIVPLYFMWYIPPVAAVVFIYAGIGLNEALARLPRARWVLGVGVACLYAVHIPFTYPLERRVQLGIEDAVRREVGRFLDEEMDADDAVVMEPLGYIGWEAFNKTTYDYPGLSSNVVTDALGQRPKASRTMFRLAVDLRPEFLAFRASEWRTFVALFPDAAAEYEIAAEFNAPPDLELRWGGVAYFSLDKQFVVARLQSGD